MLALSGHQIGANVFPQSEGLFSILSSNMVEHLVAPHEHMQIVKKHAEIKKQKSFVLHCQMSHAFHYESHYNMTRTYMFFWELRSA